MYRIQDLVFRHERPKSEFEWYHYVLQTAHQEQSSQGVVQFNFKMSNRHIVQGVIESLISFPSQFCDYTKFGFSGLRPQVYRILHTCTKDHIEDVVRKLQAIDPEPQTALDLVQLTRNADGLFEGPNTLRQEVPVLGIGLRYSSWFSDK
jgi:hypothetical protein